MLSILKKTINTILGFIGLELIRTHNTPLDRLYEAFQHFEINTVLDVGANAGQFSQGLRHAGYRERIISFEPLSDAHWLLSKQALKDPFWVIHPRGALGDQDGESIINISRNSVSSSILDMNESHSNAAQGSEYTGSESITIQKLDSIADQYLSSNDKTFLKIDTQGFEPQVLDGAFNALQNIQGVLLETSLIELYKGQLLWRDIIDRLEKEGFTIWSIERGFTDPRNGRTLQCDVVFFREKN
jgi:FkbM family methyltransferase